METLDVVRIVLGTAIIVVAAFFATLSAHDASIWVVMASFYRE
jgi:hypothetical protein